MNPTKYTSVCHATIYQIHANQLRWLLSHLLDACACACVLALLFRFHYDKMHISLNAIFFSSHSNWFDYSVFRFPFRIFCSNIFRWIIPTKSEREIEVEHTKALALYQKTIADYSFLSKLNIEIDHSIVGVRLHILQSINVCFNICQIDQLCAVQRIVCVRVFDG